MDNLSVYPRYPDLTHCGLACRQVTLSTLVQVVVFLGAKPQRNADVLLIKHIGRNFSEMWSKIWSFAFEELPLKMSSAKWRPFFLVLNELMVFLRKLFFNTNSNNSHVVCVVSWARTGYRSIILMANRVCHLRPPLIISIILIPAWMRNYIHYNVWDENSYPFPYFNDFIVEVGEWISNFKPDDGSDDDKFEQHMMTSSNGNIFRVTV